jgi:hypothetical protein
MPITVIVSEMASGINIAKTNPFKFVQDWGFPVKEGFRRTI